MKYVQENKIKTNIKMKVTPSQSRDIQKICFANDIQPWGLTDKTVRNLDQAFISISKCGVLGKYNYALGDNKFYFWDNDEKEEIDADLFIRTNGTCEEISDEGLSKIKAAFQGKPIEHLQEKVINLHKQINKDRIIIKNQREELHKLNIKLQKCVSLEEHDFKMKTVLNEKHYLEVENKSLKDSSKISCNMLHKQKDKIDEIELDYIKMNSNYKKEIEKLKAVIEYLESKVK